MFPNRRPAETQFERRSPVAPAPAPKAKRPARWAVRIDFRADGERDSFAREVDATTREAAIERVRRIAVSEYGGDWELYTAVAKRVRA